MSFVLNSYRRGRVLLKEAIGVEPRVPVIDVPALEYFGNSSCGWAVPTLLLGRDAVIVDVGLGEDISFSSALIDRFGCQVHGFDPTPRAIAHVRSERPHGFVLHESGLAAQNGQAHFYLPTNEKHVSGSVHQADHIGKSAITVNMVTIDDVFSLIGSQSINLLKIDIEGAEYEVIRSESFARRSSAIAILSVEFHHRWRIYGKQATDDAISQLSTLGFQCCWKKITTNEEFTFVNKKLSTNLFEK
jgi:FkbM family methyltransferase